jgi:hypothetical protein
MTRIWEHSAQASSDLLLLLAIADHADDDGVCWPGIDKLAKKTRCLPRQVKRNIQKLAGRGELFIQQNRGRGHTNLYFILAGFDIAEITDILQRRFEINEASAGRIAQDTLKMQSNYKKGVTQDTIKPNKKVSSRAIKGVIQDKKVSSRTVKGVIAMTPEPLEPSFKPSGKRAAEIRRPPTVQAYKVFVEETKKTCLNLQQIKAVNEVVGTDPAALEKWRAVVRAWNLNGNKLTDAAGMLDWFTTGKRSNYNPNPNRNPSPAGPPPPPAPIDPAKRAAYLALQAESAAAAAESTERVNGIMAGTIKAAGVDVRRVTRRANSQIRSSDR